MHRKSDSSFNALIFTQFEHTYVLFSGITIDQPRYYTPSLDKRKDALFASSTRSFGTYTVSQITLTNAQGLLGDFNTNTLQLKSVMGIKYDEGTF